MPKSPLAAGDGFEIVVGTHGLHFISPCFLLPPLPGHPGCPLPHPCFPACLGFPGPPPSSSHPLMSKGAALIFGPFVYTKHVKLPVGLMPRLGKQPVGVEFDMLGLPPCVSCCSDLPYSGPAPRQAPPPPLQPPQSSLSMATCAIFSNRSQSLPHPPLVQALQ